MTALFERTETVNNDEEAVAFAKDFFTRNASPTISLPLAKEDPRILNRPGWQLAMGAVPIGPDNRPPAEIVRGRCPECGDELVANMYYHSDRGYILRYECWQMLQGQSCSFYAVP